MKIQLDSSALAYLIENSSEEFTLELQSAVVQAFANKYLKALVTSDIMEKAKYDIEQHLMALQLEFENLLKESIGTAKREYYSSRLIIEDMSPEVRQEISNIVKNQRSLVLKELLENSFNLFDVEKIKKLLTEEYKKEIREIVRQEIKAEIKAKL